MGCNSSKSDDIKQGEAERKRVSTVPRPTGTGVPAASQSRAVLSPPRLGAKLAGRGTFEPRSWSEERDIENEQFIRRLVDGQDESEEMLKKEAAKIITATSQNMLDLTQLQVSESDTGNKRKLYSNLRIGEMKVSTRGIMDRTTIPGQVTKIPAESSVNTEMAKLSNDLVSAFKSVGITNVGEFVCTF